MIAANIMITRKRLIKLAEACPGCRVIYVQAPAGYGKTVFAQQWLESRQRTNAAINLDEYDNTREDLGRKIRQAFVELCKEDQAAAAFVNHADFDKAPEEFLMRAAAAMPKDMEADIVIDDLHCLTDPRLQKVLQSLLARLPEGVKTCILSRTGPPESFSALILRNQVTFIFQEQMLFDNNEVYDLYKSKEIAITKNQAEFVLDYTEGWPLGINTLLLSLKQIPTEAITKDLLQNFLKTHVWGNWDTGIKEFMIATCVENELSESLCNALTGERNSGVILERLVTEGAFLSRQHSGTYRFHKLFLEFLRKQFMEKPQAYRVEQIRKSGEWHLEQHDFYHAVKSFSYIKDYEQVAVCFDTLEQIERTGFDTEQVMRAVQEVLNEEIAGRYPYLYFMMAFAARNEGRAEVLKQYADQYYSNYERIVARNPNLAHNIFFLYIMDYRLTLKDIAEMAKQVRTDIVFQGVRGSATLYFPFYHRSYRDFSELLTGNADETIGTVCHTLGPLLGEECAMIIACIRAGLFYETGDLRQAQEYALSAVAELKSHFAAESKFCVLILLMTIYRAMREAKQEEVICKEIQKMIEQDKAYYLQFNFNALLNKNKLDSGEIAAAQQWLESEGTDIYGEVDFLRLCGHLTTARAHIALGHFDEAIILLEKLLNMCTEFNRPLDVIEVNLLLAVSFRKKKRGNQKKALDYLEVAVRIAQQFGYEQIFINDGAELESMLSGLKNRTMRSDYSGDISGTFVNKLYIGAVEQARYSKGLTGGRVEQNIQFTKQQKKVMRLMCEGYSYRKIGEELGIRFSTVRSHIELIYRKLDVSDMKEAILKIRKLHILDIK